MKGFITTRDLIIHPGLIIQGFGLRVYLRCVSRALSGSGSVTFLGCLSEAQSPHRRD